MDRVWQLQGEKAPSADEARTRQRRRSWRSRLPWLGRRVKADSRQAPEHFRSNEVANIGPVKMSIEPVYQDLPTWTGEQIQALNISQLQGILQAAPLIPEQRFLDLKVKQLSTLSPKQMELLFPYLSNPTIDELAEELQAPQLGLVFSQMPQSTRERWYGEFSMRLNADPEAALMRASSRKIEMACRYFFSAEESIQKVAQSILQTRNYTEEV